MKYKTALIDIDGTLMDSGEGIMKCAQYALKKMGVTIEDWCTLRFFVGPPLEDSFKEFYGFNDEQVKEAVFAYRERYFSVGIFEQKPYDGVRDFLDSLKARGMTLCIATSKMKRQALFVVEKFGFAQYFDDVFARDDAGLLHSKADVIRHGLISFGIEDKSEVVMIGDRKFDVLGAKECGLDSVGVLYGYGDRRELEDAGSTYICESFEDVLNIIM